METKQVIVMRRDLNMRTGKMIAQGCHASLGVFTRNMLENEHGKFILVEKGPIEEWFESSFTKICVYVNSEEEVLDIYETARKRGMPCSLIRDNGKTEFKGVPTITCCAVGPYYSDEVDKITGDLPLL